MSGRVLIRSGMAAALAALCWAASQAAPTLSERPTRRFAASFARFDSLVGRVAADSAWRWVTALEADGPADPGFRALTGMMRGRLLMQRGAHDQARPLAEAALASADAVRDTALACGALYVLAMGDALNGRTATARAPAERLLRLARAARRPRDQAQAHLTLAYLELLANRFAAAERGYRAALRGYSPALDRVPRRIARVGLSRACFNQGRVDEARRLDVELIRESRSLDDPVNEAIALNNLAVHELLGGDPADALPSYHRALAIQRRLGRPREAITTAINLAGALARLRRYDDAVEALEAFGDTARAGVRTWQRADLVSLLAVVRAEQGRLERAEALGARAWSLCDSAGIRPGRQLAVSRAKVMAERGRADEGVALLDRWVAGIPADEPDPDDAHIARAAAAHILATSGRGAEAARRWAEVRAGIDTTTSLGHMKQGYARSGEALAHWVAGDAPGARASLRLALRSWERGRAGFRSVQWRERLESEGGRTWAAAAGALLAAQPGERPAERVREAFDLLQRVKARTLAERQGGGIARPVDLRALQARVLRPGELALDVYPAYDSVLVFAVTREAARAFVIRDLAGLERRLERFAGLARDPGAAPALRESAAGALAATLLAPVADLLAGADRLIVSGGGVLDEVPWALLTAPGDPRPLIERCGIAHEPSLTVLARLRAAPAGAAVRGPLVMAGPSGPDGRALEGVRQEVDFLRGRYAAAEVRIPRSGSEVRAALDALPGAEAIHVAAHFADDPEDPWHTGVLFGDPRRDDSWVRPRSLAPLRTRARLVVLAGCASAAGSSRGLHGQRGLATAFLAAGARAVLGTLWPVDDVASAELVRRFYRALDEGHGAAGALALAQSGMRTSPGGQDASRWAGFVLLGDPDARVTLARRPGMELPGLGLSPTRGR